MKTCFTLAYLSCSLAGAQTVVYVDDSATGANDGTSWQDAFTDLQDAFDVASHDDQIWVAEGVYRPSQTLDRTAAFESWAPAYGAFLGNETSLAERAGSIEETVLTGDLAGDDGPGFTNRSDNSFHVIVVPTFSFGAYWDGFTVRGGHADGTAEQGRGGAAWADFWAYGSFVSCIFEDNFAIEGGALFLTDVDTVRDCVFRDNLAASFGGAVYSEGYESSPRFLHCVFLRNVAQTGGGGALYGYADTVAGCELVGNRADGTLEGGGAALMNVAFVNCTVYRNSAVGSAAGCGGIAGSGFLTVLNTILWENVDDTGFTAGAQVRGWYPGYPRDSCIQGWASGEEGNFAGQPRFEDPLGADGLPGTGDEDLALRAGSPCADRGDEGAWKAHFGPADLAGNPRTVNALACNETERAGVIDLGARERQSLDVTSSYCQPSPTVAGLEPWIDTPCGVSLADGPFDVSLAPAPDTWGFLLAGTRSDRALWSGAVLCIDGPFVVLGIGRAKAGQIALTVDPASAPLAPHLVAGSTWFVQGVLRDPASPTVPALSDAASIVFRP